MDILHTFPRGFDVGGAEKLVLDWQSKSQHKHNIFTPFFKKDLYDILHKDSKVFIGNNKDELINILNQISPSILIQHGEFYDLSNIPIKECRYLHVKEGADTFFPGYNRKGRSIISSTQFPYIPGVIEKNMQINLGINMPLEPREKKINYENPTLGIIGRIESQKITEEFIQEYNLSNVNMPVKLYGRIENDTRNKDEGNRMKVINRIAPSREYRGSYIQSDLKKIVEEIDAVIIPSAFETGSYVALEMQGYGVPVFGLNNGGLNNHVCYKNHLSGDYKELCININKFFHNHEQVDVELMRNYILKEHDSNIQLKKLDNVISEIII